MRRLTFCLFLFICASSLRGQQDSLLFRLKVRAAQTAGIDTTRAFRAEMEEQRRTLSLPLLTDTCADSEAQTRNTRAGVWVKQIIFCLPQRITATALRKAKLRMDSLYRALQDGATDFDACVQRFSDMKEVQFVRPLQETEEWERQAFALAEGEVSPPFFTPYGIHILKVIRKEAVADRNQKPARRTADAVVERLKREYRYTPDESAVAELLRNGRTSRTLFTLDGRAYSGADFARFASAHPAGVKRQLDGFVRKTLLDYENSRLEEKYPDFRSRLEQYRNNHLVELITRKEVTEPATTDTLGLVRYFETHRADYRWPSVRYRGMVLRSADKRLLKRARKFLKQLPEAEWEDAVRLTFQAGDSIQIKSEYGLFAVGDNDVVDEQVFKTGKAKPDLSYPFTTTIGKKEKAPRDYREVEELLRTDYERHLMQLWEARLRASYKVEIDQEALKTVNNH